MLKKKTRKGGKILQKAMGTIEEAKQIMALKWLKIKINNTFFEVNITFSQV